MPISETLNREGKKVLYTELIDPDRSRHFGRLASALIGNKALRTYELDQLVVRTYSGNSNIRIKPVTFQLRRTPDSHPHHPTIGKLLLGVLEMPMEEVSARLNTLRIADHVAVATVHSLPYGYYGLYSIYTSPRLDGDVDAQGWMNLMQVVDQSRRSGTLQLQY